MRYLVNDKARSVGNRIIFDLYEIGETLEIEYEYYKYDPLTLTYVVLYKLNINAEEEKLLRSNRYNAEACIDGELFSVGRLFYMLDFKDRRFEGHFYKI